LSSRGRIYVRVPDLFSEVENPYGQFYLPHVLYFSDRTLERLLIKAGFSSGPDFVRRYPETKELVAFVPKSASISEALAFTDHKEFHRVTEFLNSATKRWSALGNCFIDVVLRGTARILSRSLRN